MGCFQTGNCVVKASDDIAKIIDIPLNAQYADETWWIYQNSGISIPSSISNMPEIHPIIIGCKTGAPCKM